MTAKRTAALRQLATLRKECNDGIVKLGCLREEIKLKGLTPDVQAPPDTLDPPEDKLERLRHFRRLAESMRQQAVDKGSATVARSYLADVQKYSDLIDEEVTRRKAAGALPREQHLAKLGQEANQADDEELEVFVEEYRRRRGLGWEEIEAVSAEVH